MPGIVVFKRRWSVGSDDLVVPAVFLSTLHLIWVIVLGVLLGVVSFETDQCVSTLREHVLGYIVILSVCILLEIVIALVSMRGSILYTEPRVSMQYLLYTRLGILVVELVWLVIGVIWISQNYQSCPASTPKRAILGIIVCNWLVMLSVLISLWCTFDTAGRSWVKMKRYQESIKEREQRAGKNRRRSGSRRRNWRHRLHSRASVDRMTRKAMRAYEESWDRRCKFLFCCVREDRHRNSFTEVAKLFTEFFRDLDVVPSDVVAGLVLLRNHQKVRRKIIVSQGSNDVYQFLSGVPITPATRFLHLKDPDVLYDYKKVLHYMRYALAAYGWPMYMMMNTGTGLCKITPFLHPSCCCCMPPCGENKQHTVLVEDNCCQCNMAALRKLSGLKNLDLIYVTYHVDIGETPFYIAVDHDNRTVVISIRGTLSLQDVLTDLKADAEQLPVDPIKEDWLGHKGMVQAAVYIKKKIKEEMLLSQAFGRDLDKGTQNYELVLVGHSLGAGTAAILAILLHNEYPSLHCYAYSPPGGLISATAVEDTKNFITSVVVGKDVVPRIGLHQLEAMRQDLINVIKKSMSPKWKIIAGTMCCCGEGDEPIDPGMQETYEQMKEEKESRNFLHPSDSQIALTTHTPLYPPGKIIHIVRNHPKGSGRLCGREDPVYQAIWADNIDFDEVLISPTMVQDHMPDKVMEALEKVLVNVGPAKPSRKLPEAERKALLSQESPTLEHEGSNSQDIDAEISQDREQEEELLPVSQYIDDTTGSLENNLTDNPLTRSNGAFSIASDANSLSWDYATSPDAEKRTRDNKTPDRQERAKSYPASSKPRPNFTLELTKDDIAAEMEKAPLASPETLSDASSIDSGSWKGSKKFSNGYQRLTTGMPTMEPIQQSPLKHARSDGYHYFIPAPSPVDYAESPDKEEFETLSNTISAPLAQSTPMKANLPPANDNIKFSCPPKPPRSPLDMDQSYDETDRKTNASPLQKSTDPSFDLTAEEVKLQTKIAKVQSPDNYKLTFEDELQNSSVDSYVRHSPVSDGNQILYHLKEGHYSHAGRGYPHGAYCNENVGYVALNGDIPSESPEWEVAPPEKTSPAIDKSSVDQVRSDSVTGNSNGNNNNPLKPDILRQESKKPDIIVTNGDGGVLPEHQGRQRLEPFKSNETTKSGTPEDEFGNRLSQAVSDEVFLPDGLQNVHESHL